MNKRLTPKEKAAAFQSSLVKIKEEKEKEITSSTPLNDFALQKGKEEKQEVLEIPKEEIVPSVVEKKQLPTKERLDEVLGAAESIVTNANVGGKTALEIKRDVFKKSICFKDDYAEEEVRSIKMLGGVADLYDFYKSVVNKEMGIKITLYELINEGLIRYFNDILEVHPDYINAKAEYLKVLKKKGSKKFN